jgi:hypothetical protein
MAKHGNWNARPDFAPLGVERERRDKRFSAVVGTARQMFDVLVDSELTDTP